MDNDSAAMLSKLTEAENSSSSGALGHDSVLGEARARLDRCNEWEASSRRRFIEDLKFVNGDADNGYQWPNAIRNSRDIDQRPCLTMNVVRQHNLQIVNQAAKNKSSIKINGAGGGASQESAQIFKWLIRGIEYRSNAQIAYKMAQRFQVDGGIGHWRLITDYESEDSFDQEIYICPVPDPLSIFYDPDAKNPDKSDGKFAFVFDIIPKSEFREAYPNIADLVGDVPLGAASTGGDWIPKDHLMICEYFRKVYEKDVLLGWIDPESGQRRSLRKGKMPPELASKLMRDAGTRTRDVWVEKIEWYLIAGDLIVDETVWPGTYIPLVPVIGEETVIEGLMDRKGHTRAMKDAQRLYNYNASSQVEFVALQSKTPYLAPAKAIEEYQQYWNSANQVNHAYLPWNHVDDEGNPVPPPQRQEPPNASPAFQAGMEIAFNQMMMTSGQWQNQMGMMGNERTGRAIAERQEQSDTSVYHYQDNFADALRFTGKLLIDLIPKVYDTRRVRRLITDDGMEIDVEIDPAMAQAFAVEMNHQNEVVRRIFNPSVGRYDVAADVGPASGTRRQETADAFSLILTQNPALAGIIGDLMLKNLDFDDAQEAARRLRRMVPPQALGMGPSQQEQLLQQQVDALQQELSKALYRAGADKMKLIGKDEMRDIDIYKAETDRMKALQTMLPTDAAGLHSMIDQLVKDTLATHVLPILQANQGEIKRESDGEVMPPDGDFEPPPVSGARKSSQDGEWYLQDPTRQGKYLRVVPLAQERKPKGVIENA